MIFIQWYAKISRKTFSFKNDSTRCLNFQWQARTVSGIQNMIIKDCKLLYVDLLKRNKGHLMPPKKMEIKTTLSYQNFASLCYVLNIQIVVLFASWQD